MGKPNKNNNDNKRSFGKKLPSTRKKLSLEDCVFHTGNKQASDCEVALEFMLNHMKKSCEHGNDTIESLRKLTKADTSALKLTLKDSCKTDADEKKTEERQFELECKAELDKATCRTKKHESNLLKACAEFWERCSKSMKLKLEARSDCESNECDDLISLSKAIKER